jgi:hypothetical protein
MAEAQSAIFLGMALCVTGAGTACLQDSEFFCSVYYPAAALPPLAASGSIAWAWVMYVASLGCQTPTSDQMGISLGLGKRGVITTVSLMALVLPQVITTLADTCDKWKPFIVSTGSVTLNVALVIFALLLSHAGHFFSLLEMSMGSIVLQLISLLFIWIDILSVVAVGRVGAMTVYTWSMGILTAIPVVTILMGALGGLFKKKRRRHHNSATTEEIPKTGIRFPLYSWPSTNTRYHIL